jgi:hypothetical protein
MMKSGTIPLNIVGATEFARYSKMTAAKTVNMIVTGTDTQNPALVNFAGYEKVITFLDGKARAIFLSTRLNALIVVIGARVYEVNKNLGFRYVNRLETVSSDVYIDENFNSEIAIVDGTRLYVYNYGDNTFQSPDLDFEPTYIDFQDTYFIASDNNDRWHLSGSNDGLSWNALDYQQLQTKADKLRAAVVLDRQLWIIGEKASEIWYDQGQQLFPYVRDNSMSIDYGAVNRSSISEGFGMLVWLARNEKSGVTIVSTTGSRPQKISTEGLDYHLNKLTSPEKSSGFLFQQDGHIFYLITFEVDDIGYLYDFNTKKWYYVTDENLGRYIAKGAALLNNKLYIISHNDSSLYEMSTDITTYDGKEVPRIRITPPFRSPDNKPFLLNKIDLQMEQGATDEDSCVMLAISKDGGESYGNNVRYDLNPLGKRRNMVTYYVNTRANDLTMQFRFYSKGRVVVTNGTMEIRA